MAATTRVGGRDYQISGMNQPTKEEIIKARTDAGLLQREAAALIGRTDRSWRRYEAGDRQISAGEWELFKIKTNL